MVCKFLNFKFTISTSFIQNVLNYYDKDRVRACREAQIKQGDDGPLLIKPKYDILFVWPDGVIPYDIDTSVVGQARVTLDEALKAWKDEVASPKFVYNPNHPNRCTFKLGDRNTHNGGGYTPDEENLITLNKDHRGKNQIYMVDILKQMGFKAGLSYG